MLLLGVSKSGFGAGFGSLAVRLAHRIKPVLFYRLVYTGMFLTGCKLVWDGFIAR